MLKKWIFSEKCEKLENHHFDPPQTFIFLSFFTVCRKLSFFENNIPKMKNYFQISKKIPHRFFISRIENNIIPEIF